jgi:hypothetical protein
MTFVTLGLAISLIAVAFARLRARRRHSWSLFARQHGLSLVGNFLVRGAPAGRPFEAEGWFESAGRDPMTRLPRMRMTLKLRGVPRLAIGGKGFFAGTVKAPGLEDITVGDTDFDKKVLVKGADPEAVRAWLTRERREAAIRLVKLGAVLEESALIYCQSGIDTDEKRLTKKFVELSGIAGALEAKSRAC